MTWVQHTHLQICRGHYFKCRLRQTPKKGVLHQCCFPRSAMSAPQDMRQLRHSSDSGGCVSQVGFCKDLQGCLYRSIHTDALIPWKRDCYSIYNFALKWVKRCSLTVSSSLYACHGWQALPSAVGAQAGRRRRFCLIAPLMKAKIHLGQLLHGPCIPYRPCERSRVSLLFSWLLYRLQRFAEGSPALPICAILAVASSVAPG